MSLQVAFLLWSSRVYVALFICLLRQQIKKTQVHNHMWLTHHNRNRLMYVLTSKNQVLHKLNHSTFTIVTINVTRKSHEQRFFTKKCIAIPY